MKTRFGTLPVVFLLAIPLMAQDPAFYVKKPTWHETMRASREKLMEMRGGGGSIQASLSTAWYTIGPFKSSGASAFGEVFDPEKEILLEKSYGNLRWEQKPGWKDGRIIDLGEETKCAVYLYRSMVVEKDTAVPVSLGSDDGIKVWLNGGLVLARDINRACHPDQEWLDLRLKRGENRFLMKVNNNQGAFAFYFQLPDAGAKAIWELLERDFTDDRSVQEMKWETEDSLWVDDWRPGDLQELARRYVTAALYDTPRELERAQATVARVATTQDLNRIRAEYVKTHQENAIAVILTPKPSLKPKINGPKVFGVRPGNPFLFTIPASGNRPMEFSAEGLPMGLELDVTTGRITGVVNDWGNHLVTLKAMNALGTDSRTLKIVVGERIALTPPLGWNSWNCFASDVDDRKVRSAADAMVESGLINHGWSYINIDDCWEIKPGSDDPILMGEQRDSRGMINTNKKFPDMKALSDYIHAKGLKMGIYSSPGPLTCAGYTASYEYEGKDAQRYAEWGIDYLKYDWCSYGRIAKDNSLPELKKPYYVMRAALDKVKRDIVYSLCQYGMGDVWEWGADVGGNSWRTTGDIVDTWESMSRIGFSQAGHERYAGPGHWNDPDMLIVGRVGWGPLLHPTRLSPNEQYTHISLWCLLASPLLIGCDMTQLDAFTLSLLTNDEVLDVSQDPLGKQAGRISKEGDLEIWAKEMGDGSKAVGLFNRSIWKSRVTVRWGDLGITGRHIVRDLWRQKDLGTFDKEFAAPVPRHGVVLVKISRVSTKE